MPRGRLTTPLMSRQGFLPLPKISCSKSEAPSATFGCSRQSSVVARDTPSRTMRVIRSSASQDIGAQPPGHSAPRDERPGGLFPHRIRHRLDPRISRCVLRSAAFRSRTTNCHCVRLPHMSQMVPVATEVQCPAPSGAPRRLAALLWRASVEQVQWRLKSLVA